MNPIVLARLRRASLLLLATGGALATACTGGNLGLVPPAASNLARSVRIVYRIHQPAPDGYLDKLDPATRTKGEAAGTRFFATEVVSPPVPATGHYMRIGDRMIPSGPGGVFQIPPDLAVPSQVELLPQLTSTRALGIASIGGSLRPGTETPATVEVRVDSRPLPSADGMDFGNRPTRVARKSPSANCCSKTRGRDEGGDCTRRIYTLDDLRQNDDKISACDDFDDKSKGRVGEREGCFQDRFTEFVGTECFNWTFGIGDGRSSACIVEGAFRDGDDGLGCFDTHKYRFCQNMSDFEFNAQTFGSLTVPVGGTVKITVFNNTSSNETMVAQTGGANGTFTTGVETGMVKHYDDSQRKHINLVDCVWKAPDSLGENVAEATQTLTFNAAGQTKTIVIKVVQNCTDSRGRLVPCK